MFPALYSTNPQFFISLTDPDPVDSKDRCSVIISLAQKQNKRKSEHAVGFKIYRCEDKKVDRIDKAFMQKNNSVRNGCECYVVT